MVESQHNSTLAHPSSRTPDRMSSQSVSDLATRIRALTETSRNLRRVIADNEPKLGRVDDLVTHTSFRSRWTGYSYNYMDVINDSRAAAMRLSSSVECKI
ncbi:hypothetical protein C8Q77DRAFT_656881 [Trametes polyzona]|nr:hypothetical protein C8Q77DRAFT_656881 [Trametes polyzona]